MQLILKLILGQYRRHWLRTLLVLAAVVTSVAMVLVVVGGQAAVNGRQPPTETRPLGRFDANILAGQSDLVQGMERRGGMMPPLPPFDPQTLQWLTVHPQVKQLLAYGEMKGESWVMGEMFTLAAYRPGQSMGTRIMGTAAGEAPGDLTAGRWLSGAEDNQVVVDDQLARRLGPVGAMFQLTTVTGRYNLKIAGVLQTSPTQPHALPAPVAPTEGGGRPAIPRGFGFIRGAGVYVSPSLYEKLAGQPLQINRVLIQLQNPGEDEAFSDAVIQYTREHNQPVDVQTTSQLIEQAAVNAAAMPRRSGGGFFPLLQNAGMNLAILAAMFIIFNTFAMGVQERSRQLAMLRAIGMTRRQVIALIAIDALLLATLGWLIGVMLGWLLLRLGVISGANPQTTSWLAPAFYFLLGAITSYGATALAIAFPAFMAARKRPLEDMAAAPLAGRANWPWGLLLVGMPLIAVNPIAACTTLIPEPARSRVFMPISVLCVMLGFVLITPMFIVLCERLFGHIAGRALGLNPRLLRKRLSANLWQTVGSTTALMVGLGLYIVIQIWGQSMLSLFLVPPRHPDAVVTLFPEGLPLARFDQVRRLPGVKTVLPMILEHPAVAGELPDVQFEGLFSRDVIYLGCDPQSLLDPDTGMIAGTFVRGSAEQAYQQLKQPRTCLITDSFYVKAPQHFDVGKTITLQTVEPPVREIPYTIVGVVEVPGWHLLTKSANLRRGLGRTGGIVIVNTAVAQADFPNAQYQTLWFHLDAGAAPAALEQPIIQILDPDAKPMQLQRAGGRRGGFGRSGGGPPGADTNGPQAPAAMPTAGPPTPRSPQTTTILDSRFYCRVTDIRTMTDHIDQRAQGIIQTLTYYPLLALGLASLAVVSTVMMSVRTRSWEMGILRSIGLTRSQLLRHVLAEGILIGLLACVVSLCFGLLVSYATIAATSGSMGVTPTYLIPWKLLSLGIASALAVSILACVWPAVMIARRAPLRLLQDGRSVE